MLDETTRKQIEDAVASHDVVLFMKGTPSQPQCGFSATVVQILDDLVPDYRTVDVLANPAIRNGIKEYSSWPTVPQLYVRGEFTGGCDIVRELYSSGELYETLGVSPPEPCVPKLSVSAAAAAFLQDAVAQSDGQRLHLRVDAHFQARLYLGPEEPGELQAQAGELPCFVDLPSGARADGASIDYIATTHGHQLRIDLPAAPARVRPLEVGELKTLLDSGEPVHLFDARSTEEHATARISGARLLDEATTREIEALPRDTRLIFHCHHGGRSQDAAERFAGLGFREVYNVVGGIDAWSQHIDPSVPRY